ncbi:MAG TPA: hypothetical protein VN704_05825, partial [Verrucomicrobiae bacterium]|nr:hypothetical protein [Verrucomicrobiae bacterium]
MSNKAALQKALFAPGDKYNINFLGKDLLVTDKFCVLWCCKEGFKLNSAKCKPESKVCFEYEFKGNLRYFVKFESNDKNLTTVCCASSTKGNLLLRVQDNTKEKTLHSGLILSETGNLCGSKFSKKANECKHTDCNIPHLDTYSMIICMYAMCQDTMHTCLGTSKCVDVATIFTKVLRTLEQGKLSGVDSHIEYLQTIINHGLEYDLPDFLKKPNLGELMTRYLNSFQHSINVKDEKKVTNIRLIDAKTYNLGHTGNIIWSGENTKRLKLLESSFLVITSYYNNPENKGTIFPNINEEKLMNERSLQSENTIIGKEDLYFIREITETDVACFLHYEMRNIRFIDSINLIKISAKMCKHLIGAQLFMEETEINPDNENCASITWTYNLGFRKKLYLDLLILVNKEIFKPNIVVQDLMLIVYKNKRKPPAAVINTSIP